eukprot:754731-Hanusia_phi.AAC.2
MEWSAISQISCESSFNGFKSVVSYLIGDLINNPDRIVSICTLHPDLRSPHSFLSALIPIPDPPSSLSKDTHRHSPSPYSHEPNHQDRSRDTVLPRLKSVASPCQ